MILNDGKRSKHVILTYKFMIIHMHVIHVIVK